MRKDRLHEGRGWEYFNAFADVQKSKAVTFIVKEHEKLKKMGTEGSWDEANSLVLKIEGEVAMATRLGLITKRQARRIHNRYFKDQDQS